MIKVTIDTKALTKKLGQGAEEVVAIAVAQLGEYARDTIDVMIQDRLDITQQQRYQQAIKVERQRLSVTISIEDPDIKRLEGGIAQFDIKPGLLASSKAKQTKDGEPYIDVPFRHRRHKRQKGRGAVIPVGSQRRVVEEAIEIAKQLGVSQRIFKDKPAQRTIRSDMKVHATGEVQTFRRISKKSDAQKWIHPGRKGLGVFEEVGKQVQDLMPQVVEGIARARGML